MLKQMKTQNVEEGRRKGRRENQKENGKMNKGMVKNWKWKPNKERMCLKREEIGYIYISVGVVCVLRDNETGDYKGRRRKHLKKIQYNNT